MPRLPACLIVTALICLLLPSVADAQRTSRRPSPQKGTQEAAGEDRTNQAASAEPSFDERLKQLAELDRRLQAQPGAPAADRTTTLRLLLEHSLLGNTNQHGPDGIRYFATRLVLVNTGDEPLALDTRRIVLEANGVAHTLEERAKQLDHLAIPVDQENQSYQNLKPAEEITVPPRGTAAAWLLYSGLDTGANVPRMQLKLDVADRTHTLDVNAHERAALALETERLGPENCLALLTIGGSLNTVSAAHVADQLDALAAAGTARVVLAWTEAAPAPQPQFVGWLLTSRLTQNQRPYDHLPDLPASIRELHLAQLPGGAEQAGYHGDATASVHDHAGDAVAAALRSAFTSLPRDELRREIALGHPYSRAAALVHGADRLADDDLALILRCADEADPHIQRAAVTALGCFGLPAAIDKLLATARSGKSPLAETALVALAGSRYPQAHAALSGYLVEVHPEMRATVVEVLARHPRPLWSDAIFGYVRDSDPKLRLVALQALVRIGHPQLFDVLAEALRSDDADLRNEAFVRLSERTDPPSESLAAEHALELLQSEPPTPAVMALLSRTRDRRAVPLLLKHLDAQTDNRRPLIELVADVGGPDVAPELLSRYPKFSEFERAGAFQKLIEFRTEGLRPLALEALLSRQPQLTDLAAKYLGSEADPAAVQLLSQALETTREPAPWHSLCNTLAMIGTPEARAALGRARRHEDQNLRRIAADCSERMRFNSPAFGFTSQAEQAVSGEDFEKADQFYAVALEIDPLYGRAYSSRGHLRLKQDRHDDARADFTKALELDEFDTQAVTGLAITQAMSGDFREAIESIRAAAERFPDDLLFEYNTACVYGRALEQVAVQDPSAERDALTSEYQVEALAHLKRSLELGFDQPDWIGKDPDLTTLHKLQEFQQLLKDLPEQPTEEQMKAARQRRAPARGQLQLRIR